MTDTVRVLLTAAVLSAVALGTFAWRVTRLDWELPDRLIGELRLAQWAAILLAGAGAIPIGMALQNPAIPLGNVDVAIGVMFVGFAGVLLQRDPREALLFASGGFVLHALVDIAHRPDMLSTDVAPHWYTVGCATYNVTLSAVCYWARRR